MSLGTRPTSSSSPKLLRKGSRQSLGAHVEEQEMRPTPKRSISNLIANLREAQSTMESIEEPVPLTAAQIAMEHFTRELLSQAQPHVTPEAVVILHDACYGHRYSRPKTAKGTLSMIVERPERIHASVLGAATAYVRLGEHYAGARNAPHPEKTYASPPPFKIRRTARSLDITSSCVTNVHGTSWMSELRDMCHAAGDRLAAGMKELGRASTPTESEGRKLHEGDLYLCPESLDAFQGALGGVADAVDTVFQPAAATKRAFVAIRPPGHHCSADYPSGFCWINNVHVGIEYAAQKYGLTHAAIVDFDLHHGDGSQAITWERNSKNNLKRWGAKPNAKLNLSPDIGYYSLHDINSYPCEMGDDEKVQAASLCIDNAHGQSIWNVHLQPWKTEDEFWQLYKDKYRVLLDRARLFLRHHTARLRAEAKLQPKAALFISAGFDASEWEGAGMQRHKVNVPTDFYARFTREIVQLAREHGSGCEGRVISVLEGGYSDRALCSGVLSHLSGLCARPSDSMNKEACAALDDMMNELRLNGNSAAPSLCYDKSWWSAANLTALEMKVNPPPPPGPGKRVRTGPQPTYATPTESFAYKVVDPNKFARSVSGTMREVSMPARAPTPPPPEVDWVVATQELSKLLIPNERQTKSCTPEQLGGVRNKKDRQSAMPALGAAEDAGQPRQLRDRKAKALPYAESAKSDELESVRSVSRNSNRRQTMHELPSAAYETHEPPAQQQRRASRRLSAGSTLSSWTAELDADAPPVPALPTMPATANGSMKPPLVPMPGSGAGDMQVKKTRAPAKPRKAVGSAGAPVSPSMSHGQDANTVSSAPNGNATPAGHEVELLTSGMKKITLKVGSREEHDKKQEEKLAADRRARALKAAETRRVNTAAKKAAAAQQQVAPLVPNATAGAQQVRAGWPAMMPMTASKPHERNGQVSLAQPSSNGFSITPESVVPSQIAPDQTSAVSDDQAQQTDRAHMPLDQSLNTPAQGLLPAANGDATASLMPGVNRAASTDMAQPTAINSMSPATARSASNGKPRRLPIFTSTGAIPFASAVPGSPISKKHLQSPRTPPRSPWTHQRDLSGEDFGDGNGVSKSMLGDSQLDVLVNDQAAVSATEENSVWDVPGTPAK